MFQQNPNQMPAMRPQQTPQQPKPQMPQKTKFTVDDLKEIMGVIMPAIDYPGPAVRAAQSMLPPGSFTESTEYPEGPLMRLVQNMIPPAPRPRLLPTQQAVLPPGYYE
jgi:hypothetical protein